MQYPHNYYNRHAPEKKYGEHLFISGRHIQSPEFNEIQREMKRKLRSVADTIHKDGDVIAGCDISSVNANSGKASLGGGKIYAGGEVYEVASAELAIPPSGTVQVGVWIKSRVITEDDDGDLRDPAVGMGAYSFPGACRMRTESVWGLSTDIIPDYMSGDFYPIHTVCDRELLYPNTSKPAESIPDYMARYDYSAHGSYVTDGLMARAMSTGAGRQVFSISEGSAHIMGLEVIKPYATRLDEPEEPDLYEIVDEPHSFTPREDGSMAVKLNHTPVEQILIVGVTMEKTVSITHGSFSGAADPLPNTSVLSVIEVKQGSTGYQAGQDYRLVGDRIDWSPSGNEPAPGATYTVKFQHRGNISPQSPDAEGFTVPASAGVVTGSLVLSRYKYRLPRKDLLVINSTGEILRIKGVSHRTSPLAPKAPLGTLELAVIDQAWRGLPSVTNNAVRVIPMNKLTAMEQNISNLYDMMAMERLQNDALISSPTATYGVFVDPFTNDNMRDSGLEQTAAIVGGELMMPIDASVYQVSDSPLTLDYTLEEILTQTARTGSKLINPYQARGPLPALLKVSPAVDHWNDVLTAWTSGVTQYFTQLTTNWGLNGQISGVSSSVQVVSSSVSASQNMRVRSLTLEGKGFGPGEDFTVTFNGLPVTPSVSAANPSGNFSCVITVPEGVPTGTVQIAVSGIGGSEGNTTYTASGTITNEVRRTVTTVNVWQGYDPLAQTFVLPETRHVAALDLWFAVKGVSQVRIQIRDTVNGYPGTRVLAEGQIEPEQITEGGINRIPFDTMTVINGGEEYAIVVLTDTSDHEIGIAELGGWDIDGRVWVTGQTSEGVLFSSANARTWTAHQTMDMWFRLIGAKFSAPNKTVSLGNIAMAGTTDIISMAEVEYPSSSSEVRFLLQKDGAETLSFVPGQVLNMASAVSGTYSVKAELKGARNVSPVVYSDAQIISGTLAESGDYVSRAFESSAGKKLAVRLEVLLPGSSTVLVYGQKTDGSFEEANLDRQSEAGDSWKLREYSHVCDGELTRVKIVLKGSPSERPRARGLRARIQDA